jgi:hypothetical protein
MAMEWSMIRHSKLGMGASMMAISAAGMMMKGMVALVASLASGSQTLLPGLEAAVGLLLAALAWYGIRAGQRWAWGAAVAAFALVVIAIFPAGYAGLNGMEAKMLAMGAVMYAAGALVAFQGLRSHRSCCSP